MLLHHATVITFDEQNRLLPDGAVRISGPVIDAVGESADLLARFPDDQRWDVEGLLLMPGLICAHTHFYGAFARGLYIPGPPAKDFPEILERLWWRLDKALDLEGVRRSAEVCLVDAIRNGTTTLVDHHASQRAIDGSLDVIAEAVTQSGLRAALCYEVTDRDGPVAARAGIRENVRFMRQVAAAAKSVAAPALQSEAAPSSHQPSIKSQNRLAATFGLHASLTLADDTLAACSAESNRFHIHVAEHPADEYDSLQRSGQRVVERLHRFGITGPESIMAHCIHIDPWEMALLGETGTFVSHQPRSNMNNAVGAAAIDAMLRGGLKVCLGNDGFSNDMFAEMKVADLLQKVTHGDPRYLGADKVLQMAIQNNRQLAASFFARPLGIITPGAFADLILLDYQPPTPLTAENLPWHILFGVSGGHVHSTICHGQLLMCNRQLLTMDEAAVSAAARPHAEQTWQRYWAMF